MIDCIKCGNPLKVIKGGNKSDLNTTKIKTVHIFGCINPQCELQMQEQARQENEQESFEE